jgi:hypothetical protein
MVIVLACRLFITTQLASDNKPTTISYEYGTRDEALLEAEKQLRSEYAYSNKRRTGRFLIGLRIECDDGTAPLEHDDIIRAVLFFPD